MLQTIRARLVALVLAVALPLFGVLVWVFWAEIARVHNSARDLALRIAISIASDVRDANQRPRSLLQQMAQRPKIQHAVRGDCDSYFGIVDFYPQYLNLLQFDPAGNLVCSSTPAAADARYSSIADPLIKARVRQTHGRNIDTMVIPAKGKWILVLFQPLGNGQLALEEYLDLDVRPYPTGTVVTVVDGHGKVIARSPEIANWLGRDVRNNLGTISQHGHQGSAEARGIDGVPRQYGYTHINHSDWILYVGIPAGIARSQVRSLVIRGISAGIIICFVVLLFALQLATTINRPLHALARTAQRVAVEGYSGNVPADGPREVAVVGQAFNRMIASRSDAERALVDSRAQLEALSKKLLEVSEEERSRIAREIHDELGQLLTALNMDIGGLLRSAEPLKPEQKMMALRIRHALSETLSSVQRIASELRPAALDDFGLIAAVESEVRTFEERTGIECELSLPEDDTLSLGPDVDAAIYRIVQEAMTNVARHSDASRLEIRVRQQPDETLVEIRDDGKGIPASKLSDRNSLGVAGMRERARRIGATLEVEGIVGHGTIVSVRIPVKTAQTARS